MQQSMWSNILVTNDIFLTCRKVAWEDLTLECSASLSQTDAGVTTAEASADEDEDADGVEYDHDGMSEELSYITVNHSKHTMQSELQLFSRMEGALATIPSAAPTPPD